MEPTEGTYSILPGVFGAGAMALSLFATVAVNVLMAFVILRDSSRLQREGRSLALASRSTWVLVSLLLGPQIALAYWLMHHSTLRESRTEDLPLQNLLP